MVKTVMEIILPMLCETGNLRDLARFERDGWWAERKYDGVRATIQFGRLFDRRGKDITDRFPEFVGVDKMPGFWDGEVVTESGEFSEVAGRMHLRDKAKQRLLARINPCMFVWWFNGFASGMQMSDWAEAIPSVPLWMMKAERGTPTEMWKKAEQEVWEGIIVKCHCTYRSGVRQYGWQKIKRVSTVDARFVKVDVHPKGVRLETAEGRSVNVNGAEAKYVRRVFDKQGFVVCEVKFLSQENSDAWRFPAFVKVVE
jgi:ATP-dependent DNA ligase